MLSTKRSWQAVFTLFVLLSLVVTSLPAHIRAQDPAEPSPEAEPMPVRLAESQVLMDASFNGKYTQVQTFDPTDPADPWKRYDVDVPDCANDLGLMVPGRGY